MGWVWAQPWGARRPLRASGQARSSGPLPSPRIPRPGRTPDPSRADSAKYASVSRGMENARNTAIDPGRDTMKAKKSKGKAARKRAVKDLPPEEGRRCARAETRPAQETGKATFHDLSFVHLVDKASPVLLHRPHFRGRAPNPKPLGDAMKANEQDKTHRAIGERPHGEEGARREGRPVARRIRRGSMKLMPAVIEEDAMKAKASEWPSAGRRTSRRGTRAVSRVAYQQRPTARWTRGFTSSTTSRATRKARSESAYLSRSGFGNDVPDSSSRILNGPSGSRSLVLSW